MFVLPVALYVLVASLWSIRLPRSHTAGIVAFLAVSHLPFAVLFLSGTLFNNSQQDFYRTFFQADFLVWPATWAAIPPFVTKLLNAFSALLPVPVGILAALFILGIPWLATRSWQFALISAIPLLLSLAAAFDRYPLTLRLNLFIFPILAVGIVSGMWALSTMRFGIISSTILILFCLAGPFGQTLADYQSEERIHEMRSAIEVLAQYVEPGDVIVVNGEGTRTYQYYARRYSLPLDQTIFTDGPLDRERVQALLNRGTRTWILWSWTRVEEIAWVDSLFPAEQQRYLILRRQHPLIVMWLFSPKDLTVPDALRKLSGWIPPSASILAGQR